MSAQNVDDEEEQVPSKGGVRRKQKLSDPECSVAVKQGVQYVDTHRSELILRVGMVMPVVEELLSQGFLNEETRLHISLGNTDEEKMIELYKVLDAGGDRVKSAFYFELKDYEPHLFDDQDNDFSKEFEGGIILQYKSFIVDSFMFVTEYKLPSDEPVNLATRYTEPVIIQRSKMQTEKYYQEYVKSVHTSGTRTSQLLSNDKYQSIRINQFFSPDSDGNTPKTVILSGDSGRGKSFILQKIILDWASGELYNENFDMVFLLKWEELKCLSEEMSLTELLSRSCSLTSDQISEILKLTPEKVLFLIDGIDDFSFNPHIQISSPTDPSQKAPVINIIHCLMRDLLLVESSVIVTTRYTAAAELSNLCKRPQRFTEIEGFSERGVLEYFQKFFQDEKQFKKAYERVKTNETLLTFCSVPLLCWMVCFCLKKDADQVMTELKTTTSIYVHFVSTLLEDHHQSQSMLRSLGQLAEEGLKKKEVLFDEKSVTKTGLNPVTTVFLIKDSLKGKKRHNPVFRFTHSSIQEFFAALSVLLDEKEPYYKVRSVLSRSQERKLKSTHSVMMFLCGLLNEKMRSSRLFKMINVTVLQTINVKINLQHSVFTSRQHGFQLFALHCLYELQDEDFTRRALADWLSVDLSNVFLRSTDCLVLCYCLQLCPKIRDLNFMNCDLTADKLKTLLPTFALCETLRKLSEPSEEHLTHSCNEKVEIHFKPIILEELKEVSICNPGASALDLHCQSCVDVADSDQWLQVEPSVCRGEGGSEFRISTPAGRFQCSRTRMRWVCDGDVTLHYRAVDGHFLNAELERLQCERVAPVLDVNVISGKLEEAHLPHYMCLAESDPALTKAVKLLSVEDEGISLESVELTRFHAKILQPMFSPKTVLVKSEIPVKVHCDLLIFMTNKDPLIIYVYFFPLLDTDLKDKIMRDEIAKNPNIFNIGHPRPDVKIQMNTPHILKVSGADVIPEEGISFSCNVHPNFFMIRRPGDGDVEITLLTKHDKMFLWKTTIWKENLQTNVKRALKRKPDDACLFTDHWTRLIAKVKNVLPVADILLQQEIICEEQYSVIKDKWSTSQERMREICTIVRKSDETRKAKFISIIREVEPSLLEDLEHPSSFKRKRNYSEPSEEHMSKHYEKVKIHFKSKLRKGLEE